MGAEPSLRPPPVNPSLRADPIITVLRSKTSPVQVSELLPALLRIAEALERLARITSTPLESEEPA